MRQRGEGMRKVLWFSVIGLLLAIVLVGCGEKTQEDIMTDLEKKHSDMTGYKLEATMTLETGKEQQQYGVEVWHKSDSYYRVALQNENKDQSQIILRNDDGVFVLTPALNKSFRFQSDWPTNGSQVYLYESLIQDILMDPERSFTADEDHYVFQTNTNYQNKNLHTQEIKLNKKDLAPVEVNVMNADLEVLVTLRFTSFEWNAAFNDGDFDTERNMTGAQMNDAPAMAEPTEPMTVHYPLYTPDGTRLESSKSIGSEGEERVVLEYSGEKPFTIIQEQSRVVPASTPMNMSGQGEPVDLGFTIGVMTNESLTWTYNGVDFFMASEHLDVDDMIAIASSVYGTEEK